jgi:hypothetical protein
VTTDELDRLADGDAVTVSCAEGATGHLYPGAARVRRGAPDARPDGLDNLKLMVPRPGRPNPG